ncbi:MAG: glycosyltransferase family 39 protein [Gemmatimonadaceae bacterium]
MTASPASPALPALRRDAAWSRALLLVSAAALLRLIFAAIIPVFPDETYYWDWSRHLAAGYFDHPPVVALLIRLGGTLLAPFNASATFLGVRLGTILVGWVASVATIATARRIGGDAAAWRAAIVLTVLPLAAAGLILTTPDAPVLAATALGLYCVVRALECPVSSSASLRWWATTGLVLGLAFASKYTSIFLPVAVVLAIVLRPELRARLREPGPYVACVVATLVFAPVLVWNAHNGWISFVFQLRHGLGAPKGSALLAAWKHEGDFFGGQAGLASPILFVMLVIATARTFRRRHPGAASLPTDGSRFVLAMVAALSFLFFVYSAMRQRVEPNWPAPAYIPAIVLLATTSWSVVGEKWFRAGLWVAGVMSALIYVQGVAPVLPLKPAKDPIARAFGWRDVTAAAVREAQAATDSTHKHTWLAGDRYQEASVLAFFDPAHPTTFATNISGRDNQYDIWPRFRTVAQVGDNLVLVLDESQSAPGPIVALAPYFELTQQSALVTMRRGSGVIGARRIWRLSGWRGGWPVEPKPAP